MAGITTKSTIYSTGMNNVVPSGHTQSTSATALTAVHIEESKTFTLACSGAVAATAAAGFDALFVDIVAAVDAYITDTLSIDLVNHSVDYIATVLGISNAAETDIYKNDANRNYTVRTKIQIRVY